MSTEGFTEYKRREFCNDVKCPIQMELNKQPEKSEACEKIRRTCSTACRCTTYQFHHWLIKKGYIILVSSQLKNSEQTVLVDLDKKLVAWIDQQVQQGKYHERAEVIEKALVLFNRSK
jgi:hypothetical protein